MTNKVTPIKDIMKVSKGSIVELPPFVEGEKFCAKLKRPSMLKMVKMGKIPNALLFRANELFVQNTGSFDPSDDDLMSEIFDILEVICEESFVEPTYKELLDNGIELTDDQKMFVFNYSQQGVRALESFRTE